MDTLAGVPTNQSLRCGSRLLSLATTPPRNAAGPDQCLTKETAATRFSIARRIEQSRRREKYPSFVRQIKVVNPTDIKTLETPPQYITSRALFLLRSPLTLPICTHICLTASHHYVDFNDEYARSPTSSAPDCVSRNDGRLELRWTANAPDKRRKLVHCARQNLGEQGQRRGNSLEPRRNLGL